MTYKTYGCAYSFKEAKENAWRIKVAKEETTELTLEEIADKFGKDVKNIKIKK